MSEKKNALSLGKGSGATVVAEGKHNNLHKYSIRTDRKTQGGKHHE